MLNAFSRSLIIWETAIETWMGPGNEWGPRNELGARRTEQYPCLPGQSPRYVPSELAFLPVHRHSCLLIILVIAAVTVCRVMLA